MRYQEHKDTWSGCEECDLCETRKKMVFARGVIPCEVLFIGEAPGASENLIGQPFVGPAGKLLDKLIQRAWSEYGVKTCFTNLVCCVPKKKGTKIGEPSVESIEACSERLLEFVSLAKPELVVAVGKLAAKHIPDSVVSIDILHPASILRMDVSQQGLAQQRVVVSLQDAFEEFLIPF